MKKIIFIILIILCQNIYSADFKILINQTEGEHSKDSWTKETIITIDEKVFSYSLKGSGSHAPKDDNQNGAFTSEQYNKIRSFVTDNNLLVNDSLTDNDEKYKSYERFINTEIKIFVDTNTYSIKLNGDVLNFQDRTIYKNAMGLIDLITGFIKKE